MYICVICPISKQKNKDTPYICQGLSPQINPKKALTQISLMGFIWTHVGGIFISYFPQKQKRINNRRYMWILEDPTLVKLCVSPYPKWPSYSIVFSTRSQVLAVVSQPPSETNLTEVATEFEHLLPSTHKEQRSKVKKMINSSAETNPLWMSG